MAQFIPANDDWANAFRQIGGGLTEGYMGRSDENAVRKAIMDLGPTPSGRQILDALTNTKTYSNQAKQQALSNYLGVERFEQLQKNYQQEQTKQEEDRQRKALVAMELVKNSGLKDDAKERLITGLENGTVDPSGVGAVVKTGEDAQKKSPSELKRLEHQSHLKSGLETIKRMRELGKKGNLGVGSNILRYLSDNTARDYGEYEQLGKSLIQLSTTIPIRNKQEFETLAEKLYDPSIQDAQREGILNALQRILEGGLETEMNETQEVLPATERKPLSAFRR